MSAVNLFGLFFHSLLYYCGMLNYVRLTSNGVLDMASGMEVAAFGGHSANTKTFHNKLTYTQAKLHPTIVSALHSTLQWYSI